MPRRGRSTARLLRMAAHLAPVARYRTLRESVRTSMACRRSHQEPVLIGANDDDRQSFPFGSVGIVRSPEPLHVYAKRLLGIWDTCLGQPAVRQCWHDFYDKNCP